MTCFPFPEYWQKEQLNTRGRPFRGMSEEEVFTEVANLFRGQEDLLSEFGQFLPEAKRSLVSAESPCPASGASARREGSSQLGPGLGQAHPPSRPQLGSPRSYAGCDTQGFLTVGSTCPASS